MRKPSFWAGIVGAILAATYLYSEVRFFADPTGLFWVNVSIHVTNIAWILFGAFLVILYLRARQKNDTGQIVLKFPLDSPEDLELLKKQQNWIVALIIFITVVSSTGAWILNDYRAGLTLINAAVIFDLIFSIVLFCLAIALLKGRKNAASIFLYVVVVYALGGGVIDLLRHRWFGVVMEMLVAGYFICAFKIPKNRKNFRIAHLIILPTVIILLLGLNYLGDTNIREVAKKELLLEQQFANDSSNVNSAYILFLQKQAPSQTEIQDVKNAILKRRIKHEEIVANIGSLRVEFQKQTSSIDQQKTLERLRYILLFMDTHRAQAEKLMEFMNYAEKVGFDNLTDEQRSAISSFKREIEGFTNQFAELQFKLDTANLN